MLLRSTSQFNRFYPVNREIYRSPVSPYLQPFILQMYDDQRQKTTLWSGAGFSLAEISSCLQQYGETAFIAALAIAGIQGAMALYQYRSNPAGELAVPPGLTFGIEDYTNSSFEEIQSFSNSFNDTSTYRQYFDQYYLTTYDEVDCDVETPSGKIRTFFNQINKFLVFLLPWLANQVSFIVKKRIHLFHMGFIMSLISMLDIDPFGKREVVGKDLVSLDVTKETINIVVIGDSLACGIGCISVWDKEAAAAPIQRIENVKMNIKNLYEGIDGGAIAEKGPVFPKSFARTLSLRLQRPIKWRSAGVDGGDLSDIKTHCLGVIEEEVHKGQIPDVVVVLCGMNDLKKIIAKPLQPGLAGNFRSNLQQLIQDIHHYAPNTNIVFPAMPTYKLDRNSVFNIFPLSFFLDIMISLWDMQKKRVADSSPPSIMYFGLSGPDIAKWYKKTEKGLILHSDTMTSADGVHPNSRCYAHWGEFMANRFCDRLQAFSKRL